MDVDPREWHPQHQLETVTTTLEFAPDGCVLITMVGRSSGKRGNLWTTSSLMESGHSGLVIGEEVMRMVMSAVIDRPRSAEALARALGSGQAWEDVPLF